MTQEHINSDAERLKALLSGTGGAVDEAWVAGMREKYPFFPIPDCIALRENSGAMTPEEKEAAASRLAFSLPSSEALERIVEADIERFDNLIPHPTVPQTPSTDSAINKFLETYGGGDRTETEILERMIFNPVADYSQQLAREQGVGLPEDMPSGDSRTDRINRFILSVRGKNSGERIEEAVPTTVEVENTPPRKSVKKHVTQTDVPDPGNSLLSESLAKIYIKTRRYERAYEILNRLSLAFPEKNAYFADQLRFLRKLMLAESFRKKRNGEK